MSGGYYNQPGPRGAPGPEAPQSQYLQQNFGQQNPGFGPAAYGQQQRAFAPPVSEEYLRQPASAPYPTAPMHHPMHMPEPQLQPPPVVRMTEPPHLQDYQEPARVIIVQQQPRREDDDCECCALASCVCRCVDWLLTRICYVLLSLVLLAVLLGLGIWLVNKYHHRH